MRHIQMQSFSMLMYMYCLIMHGNKWMWCKHMHVNTYMYRNKEHRYGCIHMYTRKYISCIEGYSIYMVLKIWSLKDMHGSKGNWLLTIHVYIHLRVDVSILKFIKHIHVQDLSMHVVNKPMNTNTQNDKQLNKLIQFPKYLQFQMLNCSLFA